MSPAHMKMLADNLADVRRGVRYYGGAKGTRVRAHIGAAAVALLLSVEEELRRFARLEEIAPRHSGNAVADSGVGVRETGDQ